MEKLNNKKELLSKFFVAGLIVLLSFNYSNANNLKITNAQRVGAELDEIEFTISWENSWNVEGIPNNHDAVWVFIKFRECGITSNEWSHALLSTTMDDHTFDSEITYATPITTFDRLGNEGGHNTGVMIRRESIGIGDIVDQTVRLKIVGSSNGVTLDPTIEYDIKVFGIEMVYIPEGQFFAGDDEGSNYIRDNSDNSPVLIDSEDAIDLKDGTQTLNDPIPADFPKGYESFYIMKYEITQGQYVNFLNTLTTAQATERFPNRVGSDMHYVSYDDSDNTYYTTSNDRAMNHVSPDDVMSYLHWAALRPMTELEFEKACRGPLDVVPEEFAWGGGPSSAIPTEGNVVEGETSGVEIVTDGSNVRLVWGTDVEGGEFDSGQSDAERGPLAVGVYARSAVNPDRVNTGATYYGVMEMSGNVKEFAVPISYWENNSGNVSQYEGIWGDGQLTSTGFYADTDECDTTWPCDDRNDRYIWKGGGTFEAIDRGQVSDRGSRWQSGYTSRARPNGGRGVR